MCFVVISKKKINFEVESVETGPGELPEPN